MQKLTSCRICGLAIAKYTCKICGAYVCEGCFNKQKGVCLNCNYEKK